MTAAPPPMKCEDEIRKRLERERVRLKDISSCGVEYFNCILIIETLEWVLNEKGQR